MNGRGGEFLRGHVQAAGFLSQLLFLGFGNFNGQLHGVLRKSRFYRILTIKGSVRKQPRLDNG